MNILLSGGARTDRYKTVDKLYEYGLGGHKREIDLHMYSEVRNEYEKAGSEPKNLRARKNFFEIFLFCTTI